LTGLDPAYPLFRHSNAKLRLSAEDAIFVDVIHTDAGVLGFPSRTGHVDFYPNGGRPLQPGCDLVPIDNRSSFVDLGESRNSLYHVPNQLNYQCGLVVGVDFLKDKTTPVEAQRVPGV